MKKSSGLPRFLGGLKSAEKTHESVSAYGPRHTGTPAGIVSTLTCRRGRPLDVRECLLLDVVSVAAAVVISGLPAVGLHLAEFVCIDATAVQAFQRLLLGRD